ncbi:hypothetical protein AB4156_41020, partial [Cupriavidus sp. 2MCAB6]|uniref:hypothetical protein n=1 Tax=Cupriavidus sp. 2MCAB6 TaxID=3232981 RepID=UPI003F8FFA92
MAVNALPMEDFLDESGHAYQCASLSRLFLDVSRLANLKCQCGRAFCGLAVTRSSWPEGEKPAQG